MNKFISFFKNKGILATMIGLVFAAPINIYVIISFYKNIELSKGQLWTAIILNGISIVWFILPSKIEIKSKILNLIIED